MNETENEILAGLRHTAEPDATAVKTPKFTPDEERDLERIDDHKAMGDLASTGLMAAGLLAGLKGGPKKLDGVRVFSGFDGMSGLQAGLKQNGVKVNEYLASEINPSAMKLTEHNFPQTKQLGDIQQINPATIGAVDIGAFGFPCQTLSSANHGGKIGLRDLTTGEPVMDYDTYVMGKKAGHKYSSSAMGLFEAIRIAKGLKEANPNVALMFENVASMRPENRQLIDGILSKELGLGPSFKMNTKGPTNRQRLMWTNIMGEDDYNALSDRMRQVEPNDVVEPNATHQLTKKGANSLQTDLVATEEPAPIPSKVTAKVGPRTGKLATATTNETPKLMQGDIELEPNRRELANMAGLDKSFKVDAPITDKEFAHAVGNGWDLNQFKPLLTRFKNDVKGRMPKPEGRLSDENRMRETNKILHDAGMPYEREATVPTYGDYFAPEKKVTVYPHVSKRLYRSSTHMPTDGIKLYKISPNTPVAKDMQYFDDATLDYLASKFIPEGGYPKAAEDRDELLEQLRTAIKASKHRNIDYYDVMSKIPAKDIQVANQKSIMSKYGRYRPESWFADSKARLSTGAKGSYGAADHLVQLPSSELLRMAKAGTLSVRPSHLTDNIINIAEEIPQKYIMPITHAEPTSVLDAQLKLGRISEPQYNDLKSYVGKVPNWVWTSPRGVHTILNNSTRSAEQSINYLDWIERGNYSALPDNLIDIYKPQITNELQQKKVPLAEYPIRLIENVPPETMAAAITKHIMDGRGYRISDDMFDKYVDDIAKQPDGLDAILTRIRYGRVGPRAFELVSDAVGPAVTARLAYKSSLINAINYSGWLNEQLVDIANDAPGYIVNGITSASVLSKLSPNAILNGLLDLASFNSPNGLRELIERSVNYSPEQISDLCIALGVPYERLADELFLTVDAVKEFVDKIDIPGEEMYLVKLLESMPEYAFTFLVDWLNQNSHHIHEDLQNIEPVFRNTTARYKFDLLKEMANTLYP